MKKKCLMSLTLFIGFIFSLPLIFTLTNSLMTPEELIMHQETLHLIPQKLSLRQYYTLLLERPGYLLMFWKSVILTLIIVVGNTIYSVFVGGLLAKAKIRGKRFILALLILGMLLPYQVNIVPYYILFKITGLLETNLALILPMLVAPFGVIVVTCLAKGVEDEIIEAIRLETNSLWYVFWDGILPSCKGGITILVIFIFAEAWNMVEQPLIVYSNLYNQPLSVLLTTMRHDPDIVFSACVIYMIPVMINYFFFQEALEEELLVLKV